tara:strand:+ start:1582 stop:1893 length:312 start_codon:yes stop_codon:yes gene_type:complete
MLAGEKKKRLGGVPIVRFQEVDKAEGSSSMQGLHDQSREDKVSGPEWIPDRSMTPIYIDANYFYVEPAIVNENGYQRASRYGGWYEYDTRCDRETRKRKQHPD